MKSHQIAFSFKAAEASPTFSFPHKTILKAHYFLSFDAILCDYHLDCCLLTGNTVKKKLAHSMNSLKQLVRSAWAALSSPSVLKESLSSLHVRPNNPSYQVRFSPKFRKLGQRESSWAWPILTRSQIGPRSQDGNSYTANYAFTLSIFTYTYTIFHPHGSHLC